MLETGELSVRVIVREAAILKYHRDVEGFPYLAQQLE
jgi:hypothetical protein